MKLEVMYFGGGGCWKQRQNLAELTPVLCQRALLDALICEDNNLFHVFG